MQNSVFKFKQFDIIQKNSSMKVGTDGVLLGSWISCTNNINILDIGCGTGLITLMLAQKNPKSNIVAIEIDKSSYNEAKLNIKKSNWTKRIQIHNIALQNFNTDSKFDLIACNPPFFPLIDRQKRRDIARHTNKLSFEELISMSVEMLSETGSIVIIIPKIVETFFCRKAQEYHLYCNRVCYVKGNKNSSTKRVLLEFSFHQGNKEIEYLVIENLRHQYTDDYINLCKEFYLHM